MSTRRVRGALSPLIAACAGVALSLAHCSREPDFDEVFAPPRPMKSAAPSLTVAPTEFVFAPTNRVELSLGSRKRRVRGQLSLTESRLLIDVGNLASTRGHLTFDLSTLQVDEETNSGRSSTPERAFGTLTEQSLRWLELTPPDAAAARPQLRYARFSIQSVSSTVRAAHEGQIVQVAPGQLGGRRVELRVTGELELHGFRIPYTAPVVATFAWPRVDAPGGAPEQVEIAIGEGVSIDLLAHGVVPRNARGDVLGEALAELRKPPAYEARVTGRWLGTRSGTSVAAGLP